MPGPIQINQLNFSNGTIAANSSIPFQGFADPGPSQCTPTLIVSAVAGGSYSWPGSLLVAGIFRAGSNALQVNAGLVYVATSFQLSGAVVGPFTLPYPCDGYFTVYDAGGNPQYIPYVSTPPS
jgi:hypothetical protein